MTEYLECDDLLILANRLGLGSVIDVGALDAATARARSQVFAQDAYPSLELKAAALLHSLCRVPGLASGNKRLAYAAASNFLRINGAKVVLDRDEGLELASGAVDGRLDVRQIADVLTN